MKHRFLRRAPLLLSSVCAATVNAADPETSPNANRIRENAPQNPNRVSISYRVGYNLEAKFSGVGRSALSNPGPVSGGVDHEYDDGYVRVDSTHNGLGLTWNWGFDSASQVSGDNLFMHSTQGIGGGSSRAGGDDWHHGMEATYARDIGMIRNARWGMEGAFNFLSVGIRDGRSVHAEVQRITDTYALEGIDPFDPPGSQNPYRGTFYGPGPLIDDVPINRSVEVTSAIVNGTRQIDANLYGIRIGPYIEWPLSPKWTVGLNGGFTLVVADSDFRFREIVTPSGAAPFLASGSSSEMDLLPGGYMGGNVAYRIADAVTLFSSAQFQHTGDLSHNVNGKRAEVDLGQALFVTFGLNYSF